MTKEIQIINNKSILLFNRLNKLAHKILELPEGWTFETISRCGINFLPYGGVIEKLVFANKDKKERQQILKFLYLFAVQLSKLQSDKIDEDFFNSEEGYVIFKKTLEKVRLEHRETKIQLFRNFLLKSFMKEEFAQRENIDKEYILSKIDNLDVAHFLIIKWYFDNKFITSNMVGSDYSHRKKEEFVKITKYYKEFENDLMVNGLLEDISGGRVGGGHFYIPSNICKIIYHFIKYDDI